MLKNIGIIYCLKDPESLKVRYIGQTIQNLRLRLKQHLWYSKKQSNHLGHWLNNLNNVPIIEEIDRCHYSELNERELYWIDYYKDNNLVNSMTRGCISGHHTHSEITKIKIGISSSKRQLGRKLSEETKQRMSKSHKGLKTGKKLSKETISKILESRKWYKISDETKNKISIANKGRKWTENMISRYIEKKTKQIIVYNIETKEKLYSNTEDLSKLFNVNKSSINSRLNKYYGKIYRNKFILSYQEIELRQILKMIGVS